MKKNLANNIFLFFCLFGLGITTDIKANEVVEGEFIVKFKSGIGADSAAIRDSFGAELLQAFPSIGAQLWQVDKENITAKSTRSKLLRLRRDSRIEYVEPNHIIKMDQALNDPYFDQQWALTRINAVEAWSIHEPKEEVIVAVIDSGVDYTHPDLQSNMWINEEEIPNNNKDDDGNNCIDDVYGCDFTQIVKDDDNGNPIYSGDPLDDYYHGTHCAGIIAAVGNNNVGITGISNSVKIMALKVLDSGGYGSVADAILAIEYAIQKGAKIINSSWGMDVIGEEKKALKDIIQVAQKAGVLLVAAAGNKKLDIDKFPHYPASYDLDNIISVAATDPENKLANFDFGGSNFGLNSVDLGVPGLKIFSTVPISSKLFDGYYEASGTSMATPHVAGVAALLLATEPTLTYQQVKDRILLSVNKTPELEDETVTGGILNAYNTLLPSKDMTPQAICTTSLRGVRAILDAVESDNIKSYTWIISREGTEIERITEANATVDLKQAGTYFATLIVENQEGVIDQTKCKVNVPEENVPIPNQIEAHITASTTQVTKSQPIHLSGTRSLGQPIFEDEQLAISTSGFVKTTQINQYKWEICRNVFDNCSVIDSRNEDSFYKIFDSVGDYNITLTVVDENDITDSETIQINVTESWTRLPKLEGILYFPADGQPRIETLTTAFAGGISVNGEDYETQIQLNLADITMKVKGEIRVDPRHVDKQADIVVVVFMGEQKFMLDSQGVPLLWDNVSDLVAFQPNVKLSSNQKVSIYEDNLIPGTFHVHFGYRLLDGTIIANEQPIGITIAP